MQNSVMCLLGHEEEHSEPSHNNPAVKDKTALVCAAVSAAAAVCNRPEQQQQAN
jgi:hypothetical protein